MRIPLSTGVIAEQVPKAAFGKREVRGLTRRPCAASRQQKAALGSGRSVSHNMISHFISRSSRF
jgi:hypothetical protein